MDIKPIRTQSDYRAALKEIEALMSAKANTPEGNRLEFPPRSLRLMSEITFRWTFQTRWMPSSFGWSSQA